MKDNSINWNLVTCLTAVVLIIGILCFSILGLERDRPEGYNTDALYKIIEICAGAVVGIMILVRSFANAKGIEKLQDKVEEIKANNP